jgi:hypothetical protein
MGQYKLIDDLSWADYLDHPIWTFFDDDCYEVVPVNYPSWETEAHGGVSIFVACDFVLHDDMAKFLGKAIEQIYPIHYETPFVLSNEHQIAGEHQ